MALIRWEPVGELNTIQNEMNRLFNMLEIRIPKPEQKKPKTVQINLGTPAKTIDSGDPQTNHREPVAA